MFVCFTISYKNGSLGTYEYFTFYRLARYIFSCQFLFFSLENDHVESSKRSVKLLSLIFIIRCLTKGNLIRIEIILSEKLNLKCSKSVLKYKRMSLSGGLETTPFTVVWLKIKPQTLL